MNTLEPKRNKIADCLNGLERDIWTKAQQATLRAIRRKTAKPTPKSKRRKA